MMRHYYNILLLLTLFVSPVHAQGFGLAGILNIILSFLGPILAPFTNNLAQSTCDSAQSIFQLDELFNCQCGASFSTAGMGVDIACELGERESIIVCHWWDDSTSANFLL